MKKNKFLFVFLILLISNDVLYAQSDDALRKLQEISFSEDDFKLSREKKSKKKKNKKKHGGKMQDSLFNSEELKLLDSLDIKIDSDFNFQDLTMDLAWGDPVKNPSIRCDRASNLYGPVRHNSDGSIRWHQGFDYTAPVGTPVYSVGNGIVLSTERHKDYGLCIVVMHKRPKKTYYSFYAHLSEISVKKGDKVSRGKMLGKSGTSGNAWNMAGNDEHLHFEYRTDPRHGAGHQENPNKIVRTKFYSADPDNKYQYDVGVVKKVMGIITK